MKALVFIVATYAIFRIGDGWPAEATKGEAILRWIFMILLFGGCVAGMGD